MCCFGWIIPVLKHEPDENIKGQVLCLHRPDRWFVQIISVLGLWSVYGCALPRIGPVDSVHGVDAALGQY